MRGLGAWAGVLCSGAPPLHFALFSGANLAPLKTALSHGFTGLGASKTGAEKRACWPGCGRRKGAGETRKRRGRNAERARKGCGKGAEGIQKWREKNRKNSAGERRKGAGRNAERVRKEFRKWREKSRKSAGKARKRSGGKKRKRRGRSVKKRCGKGGRGAQEIWVNAEKDAGEA